jgi:hypothetical protein
LSTIVGAALRRWFPVDGWVDETISAVPIAIVPLLVPTLVLTAGLWTEAFTPFTTWKLPKSRAV